MITSHIFGKTENGQTITCYCIQNKKDCIAEIMDYGLTLRKLIVPDAAGCMSDVVLAYPQAVHPGEGGYIGVTVGRVANRIAGAAFELDGKTYHVTANEGEKCLHGGYEFCEKLWKVEPDGENTIVASCVSEDGEDGFPGRLETTVRISFTDQNELILRYSALSTKKTPLNLTNHAYFNLQGTGNVLSHTLRIAADMISEVDETLIPTGKRLEVTGTPFDFRKGKLVGKDIDVENEQLKIGGGYDHNFILKGEGFRKVAELSAANGIRMSVSTDTPCMQLYTANFLEKRQGKDRMHGPRIALCLETQGYPNAVNMPSVPSVILNAGQLYSSKTVYAFGTSTN